MISCESSAWQMILMKYQALFSLIWKYLKMSSAAVVIGDTLRFSMKRTLNNSTACFRANCKVSLWQYVQICTQNYMYMFVVILLVFDCLTLMHIYKTNFIHGSWFSFNYRLIKYFFWTLIYNIYFIEIHVIRVMYLSMFSPRGVWYWG